jgi:hypothetical protein
LLPVRSDQDPIAHPPVVCNRKRFHITPAQRKGNES